MDKIKKNIFTYVLASAGVIFSIVFSWIKYDNEKMWFLLEGYKEYAPDISSVQWALGRYFAEDYWLICIIVIVVLVVLGRALDKKRLSKDHDSMEIEQKKLQTENGITVNNVFLSPADEIKKYNELLDEGIITQEEFDFKKKELLGK